MTFNIIIGGADLIKGGEMRRCKKCGCEIKGNGLGNRIKFVGKENGWKWITRHIKQCISLLIHGFVKPEIEGYDELCDGCYGEFQAWLSTEETQKH